MTQDKLPVPGTLQLPKWPTSKPGPERTEPPPGQRPVPGRTDQMVEISYDQERGVPIALEREQSALRESLEGRVSGELEKSTRR